jgi:hypothetical protein
MAPKAYDDEETERQLRIRDPDELVLKEDDPVLMGSFRKISVGELLTCLTLLYVCTIASFNAGYFSNVHGNFGEFFSISDLVGTNISIIQYFITVAISYFLIAIFLSFLQAMTGFNFREAIRDRAEPLIINYHLNAIGFWIAYAILLVAFHVVDSIIHAYKVTNFTLVMIPTVIFQGVLLYFFWVGYKYELLPAKMLVGASLIALFISSNNAGGAWIRSDIAAPSHVQAIQDKDGICLERNILRNSSSGLLLYNPAMKQFEFRSKDWFKTIYQGRGCT